MSSLRVSSLLAGPAKMNINRTLPAIARRAQHFALKAVASDVPVATDSLPRDYSTVLAVRKCLLSLGWELAWVDGVTGEITKRTLKTSPAQCEAVIKYLMELGVELHGVENMCAICKPILGRSVDELKAVVEWVQKQGISGKALADFLLVNPTMLTYTPSADGSCLEKGKARVALTFGERNGKRVVGTVQYKEGASFGSAPVSPQAPQK